MRIPPALSFFHPLFMGFRLEAWELCSRLKNVNRQHAFWVLFQLIAFDVLLKIFIVIIVFYCVSVTKQYRIFLALQQHPRAFCLAGEDFAASRALCVCHRIHFVVPQKVRSSSWQQLFSNVCKKWFLRSLKRTLFQKQQIPRV